MTHLLLPAVTVTATTITKVAEVVVAEAVGAVAAEDVDGEVEDGRQGEARARRRTERPRLPATTTMPQCRRQHQLLLKRMDIPTTPRALRTSILSMTPATMVVAVEEVDVAEEEAPVEVVVDVENPEAEDAVEEEGEAEETTTRMPTPATRPMETIIWKTCH